MTSTSEIEKSPQCKLFRRGLEQIYSLEYSSFFDTLSDQPQDLDLPEMHCSESNDGGEAFGTKLIALLGSPVFGPPLGRRVPRQIYVVCLLRVKCEFLIFPTNICPEFGNAIDTKQHIFV